MLENIKGILFDMDGVIVDSEQALRECCIRKLHDYGITACHDDFIPFTGMGEDAFIGGVVRKHGGEYELYMKEEIYDLYDAEGRAGIRVAPGIAAAVDCLSKKYSLAVASAADRRKVLINLSVAGLETAKFGAILTGSDVVKKKPDPEIYLSAAEKIGLAPENCLVVEDAVSGVRAAKAAGCLCIAVAGSFSENELRSAGADFFVEETRNVLEILTSES